MKPTAEFVRSILSYDPETGVVIWKYRTDVSPDDVRTARTWNTKFSGREAGYIRVDGYRYIRIFGKQYLAHRLIWLMVKGRWPDSGLDHISGERANNKWINLREATVIENSLNRGKQSDNTSGYKGVSWHKATKKWMASIGVGGNQKYLGVFESPKIAYDAYCRAAREFHGQFSNLG